MTGLTRAEALEFCRSITDINACLARRARTRELGLAFGALVFGEGHLKFQFILEENPTEVTTIIAPVEEISAKIGLHRNVTEFVAELVSVARLAVSSPAEDTSLTGMGF